MSANLSLPESIAATRAAWEAFKKSFDGLLGNLEGQGQTLVSLLGGAPVKTQKTNPANGTVTLEMLQASVREKSSRPGPLAQLLNTSEEDIRRLVALPNSGLEFVGKGWVKPIEGTPTT